jgi:hypothetical protein
VCPKREEMGGGGVIVYSECLETCEFGKERHSSNQFLLTKFATPCFPTFYLGQKVIESA